MREHKDLSPRRRRRRFTDEDPAYTRRGRLTEAQRARLAELREEAWAQPEIPGGGDRLSTWDSGVRGPEPHPYWLVTELAAVDTELGILKSGKEADVHLLRRALPDGSRECLLAAKRYRSAEHRQFHRDAGYLEGRKLRRSRENRAIARRSAFGLNLIAEQWAAAEFTALCRLWTLGVPVPYPVQRDGTELLLEFLGDERGEAAPRLAGLRPAPRDLDDLWWQAGRILDLLAGEGIAHGDLSPYNVLVHEGRLVLIDLPQVVDVFGNPAGPEFLARDARTLATWFVSRGLDIHIPTVIDRLRRRAGLR
ncbi:kinase [Amycolatopsis cynarae]|uniref:non-specific serine/threonine protein kinase n=1 Tax=Amycolatopsis cynarae TaxID=2995223 RepID=A0ABY7AW02_9PSEU|nr:RIO1 family regulatory kinase/ATPase [Amycolatopsis sp. HUAS 11-8]WAL64174.1 kinase [Amycolatopsis sp. HUAS 11-8]